MESCTKSVLGLLTTTTRERIFENYISTSRNCNCMKLDLRVLKYIFLDCNSTLDYELVKIDLNSTADFGLSRIEMDRLFLNFGLNSRQPDFVRQQISEQRRKKGQTIYQSATPTRGFFRLNLSAALPL